MLTFDGFVYDGVLAELELIQNGIDKAGLEGRNLRYAIVNSIRAIEVYSRLNPDMAKQAIVDYVKGVRNEF